MEKAEKIIIPKLSVENLTAKEVLAKLEHWSKEADPEKTGIRFILDPSVDETKSEKITIELRNIPVLSVCDFIKSLSSLDYVIKDKEIIFKKHEARF